MNVYEKIGLIMLWAGSSGFTSKYDELLLVKAYGLFGGTIHIILFGLMVMIGAFLFIKEYK